MRRPVISHRFPLTVFQNKCFLPFPSLPFLYQAKIVFLASVGACLKSFWRHSRLHFRTLPLKQVRKVQMIFFSSSLHWNCPLSSLMKAHLEALLALKQANCCKSLPLCTIYRLLKSLLLAFHLLPSQPVPKQTIPQATRSRDMLQILTFSSLCLVDVEREQTYFCVASNHLSRVC